MITSKTLTVTKAQVQSMINEQTNLNNFKGTRLLQDLLRSFNTHGAVRANVTASYLNNTVIETLRVNWLELPDGTKLVQN